MQPILSIARLTWKAAFRFRLFWVLAGLLLLSVVALPLLIKDDGTARGFTQILLTYTLSVITALLGLSTLWLACGTLAREIEECQMQMVAVKPVARWQIWLGKWLGLLGLNAALLSVAGTSVFVLLQWRAARLPEVQQRILRDEILVARGSIKEAKLDVDAVVEQVFNRLLNEKPVPLEEHDLLRTQVRLRVLAESQVVLPRTMRRWSIDLGYRTAFLRDQPLYLRLRFHAAQTNATGTYVGLINYGPPETARAEGIPLSMAANAYHEIQIPANLWDANGRLTIDFQNYNNTALLFPLEDGLEVLYREGGFGLNFTRGLLIILCWLALLAAVGLAAASLLSFPVAAFVSASLLLVSLSSGTLTNVISEGTVLGVDHEAGGPKTTLLDATLIPLFKSLLSVISLVQAFSPVDALSTGRSITWGELGLAFLKIVLLLGGLFAAAGIYFFTRRELAAVQAQT